jgi:hypothetical protein
MSCCRSIAGQHCNIAFVVASVTVTYAALNTNALLVYLYPPDSISNRDKGQRLEDVENLGVLQTNSRAPSEEKDGFPSGTQLCFTVNLR